MNTADEREVNLPVSGVLFGYIMANGLLLPSSIPRSITAVHLRRGELTQGLASQLAEYSAIS